jgi:hypothetical protein
MRGCLRLCQSREVTAVSQVRSQAIVEGRRQVASEKRGVVDDGVTFSRKMEKRRIQVKRRERAGSEWRNAGLALARRGKSLQLSACRLVIVALLCTSVGKNSIPRGDPISTSSPLASTLLMAHISRITVSRCRGTSCWRSGSSHCVSVLVLSTRLGLWGQGSQEPP